MSSGRMDVDIPLPMERPPLPPKPNVDFPSFVESKLNELVRKLDDLDRYSRISNTELGQNLPAVLRGVVNDELKQISPAYQTSSQQGDHEKEFSQYKALKRNYSSLEADLKEYRAKVRDLTLDLSKKNQEVKKLHEIIHQSANDSDEMPDEEISKQFSELRYLILKAVSKHFSNVEGKVYTKDLAGLNKEEKLLSVRARIAAKLYKWFFHPKVMPFGFGERLDESQRDLESKLIEANVPQPEIDGWRIRTVKMAGLMPMKGRLNPAADAADILCDDYKDYEVARDRTGADEAREDMRVLCIKAFELALNLRGSKSMFVWGQGELPSQIPASDVEFIKDFNMKGRAVQPKPVRILFGPVWKFVDGDRILVRSGEMLFGGGPEK